MKILLTSDNHLGYKETDHIRQNDAFITFEEILKTAHNEKVDILLQAGDLFHDNAPSRFTLISTLSLLKKYCLGNKELDFESNIELNKDDLNMNISVPIISIHGNHDDPSGVKCHSSLEILKSAGLINYIGKFASIESLDVNPVLLFKNGRKIAIYGIGNIKDRRMYKIFQNKKVNFNRPADYEDYFNILVVHQNRAQHVDCDYLPVDFIDEWFDLVVYGHEHEPVMFDNKNFTVIQCGSTVRTSLCEGEKGDKFVYVLEFKENNSSVNIQRISLSTVRPFIMKSIKIFDQVNLCNILREEVEAMIHGFEMPLVRLRVETNGEVPNKIRFGMEYKERVANYKDILSFSRKKKLIIEENLKTEIDVKKDILDGFINKLDLRAIPEYLFADAVKKFTENNDKEIFSELINRVVKNSVAKIRRDVINGEMIEEGIKVLKNEINKEGGYFDFK